MTVQGQRKTLEGLSQANLAFQWGIRRRADVHMCLLIFMTMTVTVTMTNRYAKIECFTSDVG